MIKKFLKKFIDDFLKNLGYNQAVKDFLKKLKPPWKYIILVILFSLLYNLTTVVQPLMFAKLFELIYEKKQLFLLNLVILVAILLFLVRGVSQYFQGYFLSIASQDVLNEKRKEFIDLLFKQPVYILEKNNSGHLISVVMSNLSAILSDLPGLIIGYINSIVTLIFAIGWIFYKDFILGFVTVFTLPLLAIVMKHFFKKIENTSELIQQKISSIVSNMGEIFRYIRIVKSYNKEEFEKNKIYNLLEEYKRLVLKLARVSYLQKPSAEFVASLSLIFITWYSGYLVIIGKMNLFDVLVYWGYVAISVSPISNLSASLFNTKVIFGYINQFMETYYKLNYNEFDQDLYEYNNKIGFKGKIVFDGVTFGYENKNVLEDVSFVINPGDKVAIIGKSGIGKTTIISLLMKFYKPLKGKIYIDDLDLEKINPVIVRENISLLTQEVYLFSDTVYNNVKYSKEDASYEDVIDAC
ncbi:MAG: ABC transporter ATP-binding protein, partial [bacterium]